MIKLALLMNPIFLESMFYYLVIEDSLKIGLQAALFVLAFAPLCLEPGEFFPSKSCSNRVAFEVGSPSYLADS